MNDLYYRPGTKRDSRLRKWAHRHRLAKRLNESSNSIRGLESEYVETALPLRLLALYAAHHYGMRVDRVEQYGHLRRRWLLKVIR